MSDQPDLLGAFPLLGPVTYMLLGIEGVRAALRGPYPERRIWYHATWESTLGSILRVGIIPSCWWGGDGCCVFGYDRWEEIPEHRRNAWVLDVHSSALPGQLKAWWVPPSAIRGAWHDGTLHEPAELRSRHPATPLEATDGCSCELRWLVAEQQRFWRTTLL